MNLTSGQTHAYNKSISNPINHSWNDAKGWAEIPPHPEETPSLFQDKQLNSTENLVVSTGLVTNNNNTNTTINNNISLTTVAPTTTMGSSRNLSGPLIADMISGGDANGTSSHTDSDWINMPKLDNFTDIFSFCCSGAVIFGGLVPYIPQYLKIKKLGSSEGFSTYVCLTLLLANILRIAFWFGHRFELPLLYQSFVMIAGMLAMMEICVRVRDRETPYIIGVRPATLRNRRSIIALNSSSFWNWDDILSYLKFLTWFSVTLGLITYLLLDNHVYIESLGFVSAFTESMLGAPQLVRNYTKRSTRGMSIEMVILWLSGDLFKTLYYILHRTPVQFIICGAIQVTLDVLILMQVFWYKRPRVTYSNLPKST